MQIECERRIGDAVAGCVARRQRCVAQGGVGRDLMEKEVELGAGGIVERDGVGGLRADGDAGTHGIDDRVVDQA